MPKPIPTEELIEEFIFQNILLYKDRCSLDERLFNLERAENNVHHLKLSVAAEQEEVALQVQQVNDMAFELMLRLSCRQFAKIMKILEL